MRKKWLVKILALIIFVLFINVSYQPIIAENTSTVEKETDYSNVDFEQAKNYLFWTIIEIVNKPDVKNLFERSNHKTLTSDYDYKSLFSQLFFKKPRLLKSILFTKPEATSKYLEKSYVKGIELVNIFGKEKSLKMTNSINVSNSELFVDLNNIVLRDKDLSSRVSALGEINNNVQCKSDFGLGRDIICTTLLFCFLFMSLSTLFFGELLNSAEDNHRLLIALISTPLYFMSFLFTLSIFYLAKLFDCGGIIPTPPGP